MRFEEANRGPATVLIAQREDSGAQELENALVTQHPGIICVRAKTVQGATDILSTIKPGRLFGIVVDPSVDLEGHRQKWNSEGFKFLKVILKNRIYDSGSVLLLMAQFFHPDLRRAQIGLFARPVTITSTYGATRANNQMQDIIGKLPGTVFEMQKAA